MKHHWPVSIRLVRGQVGVEEAVRFRPDHSPEEPIVPHSGLDDDGTLPMIADCDECVVRVPQRDVYDGIQPACTAHHHKQRKTA